MISWLLLWDAVLGFVKANKHILLIAGVGLWFWFWFGLLGVSNGWGVAAVLLFNPINVRVVIILWLKWDELMMMGDAAVGLYRANKAAKKSRK